MRRTEGRRILYHGFPMNRVQWDEAAAHIIAMHLRKSTGAKSIRLYRIRPTDRHAACERESGYVTHMNRFERPVPMAVTYQ